MSIIATALGFIDLSTVLIFIATLLIFYYLRGIPRGRHPPGPLPFPLLGNLPQLASIQNPYETYVEWAKHYGDVFMLKIGDQNMVIVNGYKLTREGLIEKSAAFENRPNWLYVLDQIFHRKGILWSNGDPHRSIRKFTVVTLRDFGVGKKSLEDQILEEARMMIDDVGKMAATKTPFYPKLQLVNAVSNIICGIVFGSRFDYSDAEFRKLQELLDYLFKHASVAIPENFFPWLRWLGLRSPATPLIENSKVIKDFVKRKIVEHEETYDDNNVRDYIDLYIKSVREGVSREHLTEEDILRAVEDLFLAGSESTAMTLVWAMLFMVHYPDVQKKCQAEITKVVGDSRQVSLADKPNLPYIQATIQEVQRIANTIPFTAPHSTTCDVELGDYIIPQGAIVLFSLFSIHTDPEHWPDPMRLHPERWLDDVGQLKRNERFLPFSLGPRTCLGEPLAKMELFLFFTNLLQAFNFKPVSGEDLPSLKGSQPGMTMQPTPYKILAERR